jgi:hypothetical protein
MPLDGVFDQLGDAQIPVRSVDIAEAVRFEILGRPDAGIGDRQWFRSHRLPDNSTTL